MTKIVSFWEAVRKGLIPEGSIIDWNMLYPKTEGSISLESQKTGAEQDQLFERDKENLIWTFYKDNNGLPTLYGNVTKFKLGLFGIEGFKNGVCILNKIGETYSNNNYGILGRATTYQDVRKNECLTKNILSAFWLGTSFLNVYSCIYPEYAYYGLRYVGFSDVLKCNLYDSESKSDGNCYGFRPAASILRSDILVDLNSTERNEVYKLLPPDYKEI